MEQKIGLFPELPPDERREVEEYVQTHPHLRAAFEAVVRLDRALRLGRVLSEDPPTDEALAYVAVMRDVDAARMPRALRNAVHEIDRRIAADAALRTRYEALLRRRADLEGASDIDAQLRRLMGPSEPAIDGPPRGSFRDERPRNGANATGANRLRRLATAAVAVAAVYALLFVGGRMMRPEAERLARFHPSELALEGYEEVRGSPRGTDLSPETVLYLDALSHLREAETSFLGLFPSFDVDRLDSADERLRQLIAVEPPESFLAGEAAFLLGKTALARGNVAEARQMLGGVAASGGRRAGDAERLLREIED